MASIFGKSRGMNIVGQGAKIILFTAPSLAGAAALHAYLPQGAALPGSGVLRPLGYLLLAVGVAWWATAVAQLLTAFSRGRLVTTGAYGVVRNPIYASVAFLVLPGVALLSWTWVWFVPAIFLCAGVVLFIGKEERALVRGFGRDYEEYMARVDRLIPFRRPGRRADTWLGHGGTGSSPSH